MAIFRRSAAMLAALITLTACAPGAERRQAGPASAAVGLDAAVPAIGEELLVKSGAAGRTLAVGELTDADGRVTALSALVSEKLEKAFTDRAAGRFKVVSRGNLEDMASEWDLSVKGRVDDEALIEAGKLLGAQVLCVGRYAERGGALALQAKLLDAKDGQVLAASEATVLLADDLRLLANKPLVARGKAGSGSEPGALKVEVWSDKLDYKAGEKMRIYAKANQDGYLTLIDVGTSGSVTTLFPNLYHPSHAIKGGVTYTIPDPETAGYDFEVSGPAGLELVRAIASKEPVVELKDLSQPSEAAPFTPLGGDVGVLTRDIKIVAKKAVPGRWSEAVLKLNIR